jgi:hypothetical protein
VLFNCRGLEVLEPGMIEFDLERRSLTEEWASGGFLISFVWRQGGLRGVTFEHGARYDLDGI